MKKCLSIVCLLAVCNAAIVAQTLPPVVQALYNEAYHHDSAQVNFALNHGARVLATPDGNSFYIQWIPPGATASATPLIITLHGSDGYAFAEFYNWFSQAQAHGCGIIALQWFRGASTVPPADYFTDTAVYSYIDSALARLHYPSGKAFLHGFSRGAARSYAITFLDAHGGHNYFCSVLSNSGSAQSSYPLYAEIDSGKYGTNVFAGKQWALFCGGQDPDPLQSGCTGMNNTQTWLQSKGATVGMFIMDATLGHAGFHSVPAYIDSVLDFYSTCFNGTSVREPNDGSIAISVFPNPCHDNISMLVKSSHTAQCLFAIRNMLGITVLSDKEVVHTGTYTKTISLASLPPGIYALEIASDQAREIKMIIKQ